MLSKFALNINTLDYEKENISIRIVSRGKRHYFLDFNRAANNSNYIQFTRSEQQEDGSFKRWSFLIFEEMFEEFITAFSSLFQSAAYQRKGYTTVKQIHEQIQQKGIKAMEPESRPRERMAARGTKEMENAELLAILIGSGSVNENAIELASRILDSLGGSLQKLAALDLQVLCRFKGMGMAKSCSIMATVELGQEDA